MIIGPNNLEATVRALLMASEGDKILIGVNSRQNGRREKGDNNCRQLWGIIFQ